MPRFVFFQDSKNLSKSINNLARLARKKFDSKYLAIRRGEYLAYEKVRNADLTDFFVNSAMIKQAADLSFQI